MDRSEEYGLHRLPGVLLSHKLSADEKLDIIETEYHIPLEDSARKDANYIYNLS